MDLLSSQLVKTESLQFGGILSIPPELVYELMQYLDDYEKILVRSISKLFHVETKDELQRREDNIFLLYAFIKDEEEPIENDDDDEVFISSMKEFIEDNNLYYIKLPINYGYNDFQYAIQMAVSYQRSEIIKYLIEYYDINESIYLLVSERLRNPSLLSLLEIENYLFETKDININKCFELAISKPNLDVMEYFIRKGALNSSYLKIGRVNIEYSKLLQKIDNNEKEKIRILTELYGFHFVGSLFGGEGNSTFQNTFFDLMTRDF